MNDENRQKPVPETHHAPYAAQRRPKLKELNVASMLATDPPPVPWLADPIAVRGALTLVAGREGQGKSLVASAVAVAVATGAPVAGIPAQRGTVLVIDAENGQHEIHRRVRGLGLPAEAANRFHVVEAEGFSLASDRDELLKLMKKHRPDLVVLDSFRSLWPGGDENDSAAVHAVLDPLRNELRRLRAAGILLHHAGKNGGYRGSTGIGAACEITFALERVDGDPVRERRRLRNEKCRPAAEPPSRWLTLDAEGGRVHVNEAEPYEGDGGAGSPVRAELREPVLEAVRSGAVRLSEIARSVHRPPKDGSVRRVLSECVEEGILTKTRDGSYGVAEDCENGPGTPAPGTPTSSAGGASAPPPTPGDTVAPPTICDPWSDAA